MSRLILFTALALTAFTSCSVYRSGQTNTPDDVYYSPAREGAAYVETEKKRDGYYRGEDAYANSYDDRWLRMRVRDRYRWSAFDDYDLAWNNPYYSTMRYGMGYSYNPYWNYGIGFNNYWNAMYQWNSFYNPYYGGIIVVNPKGNQPVYTAVRNFSLNRYTTTYNNANRPLSSSKLGTRSSMYDASRYNNSNSRSSNNNSLGSSIRKVFSNGNTNSGSNRNSYYTPGASDRPTRTYTPSDNSSSRSYTPSSSSSSSSSGSSGGGGGGGGVSRPSRGN